MAWTRLERCYGFDMRLFIGGREAIVPARWYFCDDDALDFPGIHGCEASVWLKQWEVNRAWGEVTPAFRTWRGRYDKGENRGYHGQCYVGARQWFIDGRLPADILDGPVPTYPDCCRENLAVALGGLVLGGGARPMPVQVAAGSVILGGSGAFGRRANASGGLVLGGSGRGLRPPMASASGGLVLGGSASENTAVGSGGLLLGGATMGPGGNLALAKGGLLLGGATMGPGGNLALAKGGLVFGGSASENTAVGSGGLMLGGATMGPGGNLALASGGLVFGGSGTGGGGGGGTVPCGVCPHGVATASFRFTFVGLTNGTCTDCAGLNGPWTLTYTGGCLWQVFVPICDGFTLAQLSVTSSVVQLSFGIIGLLYSTPTGAWDCRSPIILSRQSTAIECTGFPSNLTLTPV